MKKLDPHTVIGLREWIALPDLGVVGLRADERGNYGTVVRVMDVIKQAGGERLALGTRATP